MDGRQAAGQAGAVGPVEAADGSTKAAAPTQHTGKPVGRQGWSRLPPASRAAVAVSVCAVAAVAAATLLAPSRRAPESPAPPPWPAQAAAVSYLGPGGADRGASRTFTARIRIAVEMGPPVTVRSFSEEYAGMTLGTAPDAPLTVRQGASVPVELRLRVTDCGKAPRGLAMPFINVTLRNARAIQTQSEILGDRYARDLSAALARMCGSSADRNDGTP